MRARLMILTAAAFAGGNTLSACASTDRAESGKAVSAATSTASVGSGRSCFFPSQVNGFRHVRKNARGSDSVLVSVGPGRTYLFETLGSCPNINWSETIGFDQFGGGQICDGLDVTLVVPSSIGPQRCPVKMIRQLSAEEAKAY